MKSVFITGANKGVGYETARALLKNGFFVYLGSRKIDNGLEAVDKLKTEGLDNVAAIQIDVTDQESIVAARAEIGGKSKVLDALINNAGISGGGFPQTALDSNINTFKGVFDTNLFGVVRVTQSFIDLLRKSTEPRIVNVSSSGCSITLHSDPSWEFYDHKAAVYGPSKAAMNMYTVCLAYELRNTAFKVNAVDPGFVATDFNNQNGTDTAENAGVRIAKYAMIGQEGPSGKFISEFHNPETGEIPW
ncbi:SDR family NAD(P)-dependent oxidoreductase [Anditalea andensis]|uniref:Short-chain dehydrogenase n=1 Tax=Anditalea andensis TaxID=1048983 RepID=A0A074LFY1_9BACT|nr:SDR family NAD(P)-dependent oxidoreductase [Anditalea andensis]KEO72692.1 short-chain dehydrogenase [Anditalea andensis]